MGWQDEYGAGFGGKRYGRPQQKTSRKQATHFRGAYFGLPTKTRTQRAKEVRALRKTHDVVYLRDTRAPISRRTAKLARLNAPIDYVRQTSDPKHGKGAKIDLSRKPAAHEAPFGRNAAGIPYMHEQMKPLMPGTTHPYARVPVRRKGQHGGEVEVSAHTREGYHVDAYTRSAPGGGSGNDDMGKSDKGVGSMFSKLKFKKKD